MSQHILSLIIFFILLNFMQLTAARYRYVSGAEQDELDRAQRNAECCSKSMKCCVRISPPPIEIRAVLVHCPNIGSTEMRTPVSRTMNKPILPSNLHSLKSFQGFDEDEPLVQSRVVDCKNKVVMTIKLHHQGPIACRSQYIVLDHVYDPVTDKSARLIDPYVIRLKQEPVSKSFKLKFVDYVNSEAREEVHNKQESNYTGCYLGRHATCGLVRHEGRVIPYSDGFCCSCDTKKNLMRQPGPNEAKGEESISYSDPAYLLDRVACPRTYFSADEVGADQLMHGDTAVLNLTTSEPPHMNCSNSRQTADSPKRSRYSYGDLNVPAAPYKNARWKYTTYAQQRHSNAQPTVSTTPRSYLKRQFPEHDSSTPGEVYFKKMSDHYKKKNNQGLYMLNMKKTHGGAPYLNPIEEARDRFAKTLARKMRQTFPSGVQKRGGQNCADRFTPSGLDPEHYHESAHCLRFADVWYGIYKLGAPTIEQILFISIYERYDSPILAERWRQLTNGTIRLGNRFPHYQDDLGTISITLSTKTLSDPEKFVNWDNKRILIPEGVKRCDIFKHPEMRGGPEEYLVVPLMALSLEGELCNRIGVGFEAFVKQPTRCGVPRGTCLHNQPKHLWRQDKTKEMKNKRGCYFLKYHANITREPFFVNETTGEKFLFVEYTGRHMTMLDIEIRADRNGVVRDLSSAVISEVYVDATCNKYTTFMIKVINSGMVSTRFMVQLSDFPLDVPEAFNRVRSKMVTIAPQMQHIFTLDIRQPLPTDLMYCSVEVLNKKKQLVSLRRVRVQRFDRCVCAWYCLCACVASITGLKCNPMSLEHYQAAGFIGSLPIVTYIVHFTMLDDLLSISFYFVIFLLGMLLLMGLFKALMGLCCLGVGVWGLPVVLELPKPMKHYYEHSLSKERVIYDKEGWPVDPFNFTRVKNISTATQFCSNLVFFFTYPFACTIIIFRRLCCPYYSRKSCPGASDAHKATCCKKMKRKSKSKSKKCDNPDCDPKSCLHNEKNKKKKGDESPRHKKGKSDHTSKSSKSTKSAKSSKSAKDGKAPKQKVTTGYASFPPFGSAFQQIAEVKASTMNFKQGRRDEVPDLSTGSEVSTTIYQRKQYGPALSSPSKKAPTKGARHKASPHASKPSKQQQQTSSSHTSETYDTDESMSQSLAIMTPRIPQQTQKKHQPSAPLISTSYDPSSSSHASMDSVEPGSNISSLRSATPSSTAPTTTTITTSMESELVPPTLHQHRDFGMSQALFQIPSTSQRYALPQRSQQAPALEEPGQAATAPAGAQGPAPGSVPRESSLTLGNLTSKGSMRSRPKSM